MFAMGSEGWGFILAVFLVGWGLLWLLKSIFSSPITHVAGKGLLYMLFGGK